MSLTLQFVANISLLFAGVRHVDSSGESDTLNGCDSGLLPSSFDLYGRRPTQHGNSHVSSEGRFHWVLIVQVESSKRIFRDIQN